MRMLILRRSALATRSRTLVSVLTAMALVVLAVLTPFTARAAQTWDVQAGLDRVGPTDGVAANQFGPRTVVINVGDTVAWTIAGFHTVTFPSGPPPQVPQPTLAPGELDFTFVALPAGGTTFDGSQWLSSGLPQDPSQATYRVTFTKVGVFDYVCLVHPGMHASLVVLPEGAGLPETPAATKARGQAELGRTADSAATLGLNAVSGSTGPVHFETLGLNNGDGGSYEGFVYKNITVARGDWIQWTMADPQEAHTVTFLSGAAPPDVISPRPNAAGPPSLVIPATINAPQGGSSYTGSGIVSSGILTDSALMPGAKARTSWGVKMDAAAGKYTYICLIHPFMVGTVTVTP
jgi:plastocyanin